MENLARVLLVPMNYDERKISIAKSLSKSELIAQHLDTKYATIGLSLSKKKAVFKQPSIELSAKSRGMRISGKAFVCFSCDLYQVHSSTKRNALE